jgi:hypothetical protein
VIHLRHCASLGEDRQPQNFLQIERFKDVENDLIDWEHFEDVLHGEISFWKHRCNDFSLFIEKIFRRFALAIYPNDRPSLKIWTYHLIIVIPVANHV